MTYSKEYLKKFDEEKEFGTEESQRVTQELIDKIQSGEKLSLAEEEHACSTLELLMAKDSSSTDTPQVFGYCDNYWFKNRYLLYFNNLDGNGDIFYYKDFLDLSQKKKDREYIELQYQEWNGIINNPPARDIMLQYLSTETKHQIKEIERYCKTMQIGRFLKEYLIKSIVLHSKFIYLIVKEFYQELGKDEERVDFFGQPVVLDSFSYIHILFRHYSATIKQHQLDKSYHYNENIDYRNIPHFLKEVITKFKDNCTKNEFDRNRIYFSFTETIYAIWFRAIKISKAGNVIETTLRLQTFYPLLKPSEKATINGFRKVTVEPAYVFFVK
jgi:hypothetical protein